jgi:hypothetical protein
MATILPLAETQFCDALGVPLTGGTVAFFAPGTTTIKNTWQDQAQTILNSNPVTLDSSGRAIIFGSGSYRQVVKDQFGNLIWDQTTSEPISGSASFGGTSTGTVNAQIVSAGTWSGADGSIINFTAGLTNTGSMTITVGVGGSPIALLKNGSSGPVNLVAGDVTSGNIYSIAYSVSLGTFQLLQSLPAAVVIATQAQAIAGADNTTVMTPLRTSQAIGAFGVPATAALVASWSFRFNPAGTLPEYAHPLATGNFSGLKVTVTSSSAVTVTASLGLNVSADITVSGAGGLDTGAEASSTWYYVWVIWSGTTAAALLSTSSTAPTMPATYVNKVLVGAIRNDNSFNLWRMIQYGRRAQILVGTNPTAPPVIVTGSNGNVLTATSISGFVPSTASVLHATARHSMNDNTIFMVSPNASYTNTNAFVSDTNSGITGSFIGLNAPFSMVLESTNIYYASSTGNSVLLNGWELNI